MHNYMYSYIILNKIVFIYYGKVTTFKRLKDDH